MKRTTGYMNASTIKLPLAIDFMEFVDQGKIHYTQYKKLVFIFNHTLFQSQIR